MTRPGATCPTCRARTLRVWSSRRKGSQTIRVRRCGECGTEVRTRQGAEEILEVVSTGGRSALAGPAAARVE